MNSCTIIDAENGYQIFVLDRLSASLHLETFSCSIPEYSDYLTREAIHSQNEWVAITWILQERTNGEIAAYMSLIADAIKLSTAEKETCESQIRKITLYIGYLCIIKTPYIVPKYNKFENLPLLRKKYIISIIHLKLFLQ